jgi:hypothetical protein
MGVSGIPPDVSFSGTHSAPPGDRIARLSSILTGRTIDYGARLRLVIILARNRLSALRYLGLLGAPVPETVPQKWRGRPLRETGTLEFVIDG